MFSVHIRNRNLLTKGLNFKIYVVVNCASMKLRNYFDGEVCMNVLCVPITTEARRKTRGACGTKHVHFMHVHLCMLNLAIYTPK